MWLSKQVVMVVRTKAKHVIWWSQYCEHQGLACEADEDCLMKNLLEPTWTRIIQVKTCANMKIIGCLGLDP